jgi:hypothetical protein
MVQFPFAKGSRSGQAALRVRPFVAHASASQRTSMEKPSQFMQEIVCPSCSSQGHATWEASDTMGGLRRLATVSDGFQVWPAQAGLDPVIGCKNCGTMQRDQKEVGA